MTGYSFPVRAQDHPVAVGGVGGSGTRIVASILASLGYNIGFDLNESQDNLWFTLMFKYREALFLADAEFAVLFRIFKSAMTGQRIDPADAAVLDDLLQKDRAGQHDSPWLEQRLASLTARLIAPRAGPPDGDNRWAWKEPNTHLVLPQLSRVEPNLRYIHVARNGVDMAFSGNQNQLKLWGPLVLDHVELSPRGSLSYWRWAHERVLAQGKLMGGRFFFLNFDDLCGDPPSELNRLCRFLGRKMSSERIHELAALVQAPASIGRHHSEPLSDLDSVDLEFVASLGFCVAGHRSMDKPLALSDRNDR